MRNKNLLCCVVIIILILVGVFFYVKKNNLLNMGTVNEGFESQPMELKRLDSKPDPDDNTIYVILFYVDWCPHCVSTKPEWKKLENLDNKKINNKTIKVLANNCEGSNAEKGVANDVGVEGYPTIKVLKNNSVVDYNGARDANSIKTFVEKEANNS